MNEKFQNFSINEEATRGKETSRKTSHDIGTSNRRDISNKTRSQGRSLSNAPLARAESIEIENNKKAQQSSAVVEPPPPPESVLISTNKNRNRTEKFSEEETSSSTNEIILNNELTQNILINQLTLIQQQPSSIFKKSPLKKQTNNKIKSKTAKLFRETESSKSNNDIPVQIAYESEDLLDESDVKLKKIKRKKSLTKTKSTITTASVVSPTKNSSGSKKLNNKSTDDLLISSSLENTKADESEDGLGMVSEFLLYTVVYF